MFEVTLLIKSRDEAFEVKVEESVTIGRSDAATIRVTDDGLSRVHATIHRNREVVWIVDEGSTNGSFVNGQEVLPEGARLSDGDEIAIGNYTTVFVEIRESRPRTQAATARKAAPVTSQKKSSRASLSRAKLSKFDFTSPLFIGIASCLLIIVIATIAIIATRNVEQDNKPQKTTPARTRLIEPREPEALFDEWDVEEQPLAEEDQPTDETFRQSVSKVKEERGEPVGYEAAVEIPAELKHYSDRRRNLAIQAAKARELNLRIPHDYSELADMIREKQLTELKPVGEAYVLYAVGGGVNGEQFTHFDKPTQKSVPLFASSSEMQTALAALPQADERKAVIASFYTNGRAFSLAQSELGLLNTLARDFEKKSYDLNDAAQRKALKWRMLCFLRPEALKLMLELAASYKARFNRPLPLASLIRTEEYQRELSERNVNAARNSLPPHTTGCAFDISYRYMNAAEQNFLMSEIARLEQTGRVEALRENNNCFHVFAFPDSRPPPESLIQKSM
ncbi:MAG: FHA domain-containing protein [Acidobacteria bacterium]|nr:FHA domain-containing protein [Acidobacteriota bacterium]